MKWYNRSIAITLTGWFLAFSTVPILIVSWIAYDNAVKSLEKMEHNKLEDTAQINVRVVNDWFKEIERDLTNWSERPGIRDYIQTIRTDWKQSALPLKEYTISDEYIMALPEKRHQLELLKKDYDFIYDLFLIDIDGNILFNITNENDLGTNLIQGEYATTLFAQSFRQTKEDGKTHFSDLERYKPSNNIVTGFITLPIKSLSGQIVGVLAVQINLESMFHQFEISNKKEGGIKHYLVGSDGLLRTQLDAPEEVLTRRISTAQFWKWYKEHSYFGQMKNIEHNEEAFYYTGPDGKEVLGKHFSINVFGIQWMHISEMDVVEMNKPITDLAQKTILLLVINLILVILFALWIARRISRPILELKKVSDAYTNGERDIRFPLSGDDEIGKLSLAFQSMVEAQSKNEKELQRHAQEAHRALELLKEQKLALDAHAIVATTDVKGTILYVNDKLVEISGYSKEELVGNNHRILNSGYHPKEFWTDMYKTITHGAIWHGEVCNRRKNGKIYWVDTTIVPFLGDDGKPESYIAIRTDITEQVANTEALSNALALQNAIFDSAGVSIIITDDKGLITQMNHAAEEMLGYQASEMINKLTPAIIHKPSEVVERAKLFSKELDIDVAPGFDVFVIKAQFNVHNAYEWTYVRKDGSEFPVLLTVSALRHTDGTIYGYMGLATDITILKEAEQQMIQAKQAAEDSARAKSEFLAAMSHEIRTPMNGVLGMLGLLSKSRLDETQRHQVHVAESSAHSLLGLINDILDFSKVEAGKMNLDLQPMNLHEELGDFAEAIAFKAQEKKVELLLDVTELPDYNIISDSGRIRQILTNLVGNAIKFTHSGEIIIKVTMEVTEMPSARLIFDISDTGIGIAPEKLETLFEAFTQADSSTTRKYGGTGLGLAIVKKLCELMGGTIKAKSAVHQGSTFSAEIQVEIERAIQHKADHINEKLILVVDDNIHACTILQKTLSGLGATVDIASNSFEAIDRCVTKNTTDEREYDMVLIDKGLQDIDGMVLGEEIHKLSRLQKTKLVLMSPIGAEISYSELKAKGFVGYFAKPYIDRDGEYLEQLFSDNAVMIEKFAKVEKQHVHEWPKETRLLMVEDNPTNQIVAEGMLNILGLKPEIANNGLEALEMLTLSYEDEKPYTLILMDCQMPEMDGYETTRNIRSGKAGEDYQKIPVIALTANAMSGDREQCVAAGMDDYLSKPINPDELERMLLKWIQGIETVSNETQRAASGENTDNAIWDQEGAIKRIGGKKEFLSKIVASCRQDAPGLIQSIEEAIANNDLKSIQLHSHSIKGSAGNVSAYKVQMIAKEVEASAKEGSLEEVIRLFPMLKAAVEEVIVLWDEYLNNVSDVGAKKQKKKIDPLTLAIELQSIKTKITAGDYIETFSLPIFEDEFEEPLGGLITQLKEMIDKFENVKALDIIESIMQQIE